ncbi:MAG: EamA family transporter [Anaerolineales bacterium]|nr:MAG: EamA family transporter [Anaerolineales bacterium]
MSQTSDHPSAGPRSGPDSLTLIAFAVLVCLGGSNAVAVRFSNLELPPFWGAAIRFIATAVIFWAILLGRRIGIPAGRALIGSLLYGVLAIGVSYAFLYWSLLSIQAGLAMIILALGPLLTMLFAAAHRLERFKWRALTGALTALAGITLAVGPEIGVSVPMLPLLGLLAGAASLAEGAVVFKLFPKTDPLATNAIATSTGAAILILVSLLAKESWFLPSAASTWAAFTYLVLIGSVVLFYLYLFVLSRWTATGTSYAFLLFPVATVIIAALLSGEVVTPRFVVGGLVVLLGVWIGALRQPSAPPEEPEPMPQITAELTTPPRPGCA